MKFFFEIIEQYPIVAIIISLYAYWVFKQIVEHLNDESNDHKLR